MGYDELKHLPDHELFSEENLKGIYPGIWLIKLTYFSDSYGAATEHSQVHLWGTDPDTSQEWYYVYHSLELRDIMRMHS